MCRGTARSDPSPDSARSSRVRQIEVALDDGSVRRYEVVERAIYAKLELPRERLWRNTGPEELVLITCGGDFNPEIRRYRQNIVVFAVPIA